ncbi:hypothetical protein QP157_11700 [Sphingomonas sp. LR61]
MPRNTTSRTAHGTTTPATAGQAISPAKGSGPPRPIRSTASRFVRFDTGSSRDAVFASQTVVSANGIGGSPTRRASEITIGVSSTAVVSIDRNTVQSTARTTTAPHSPMVRPPPTRAATSASRSNTPASAASSATIVSPRTNPRTGRTRSARTPRSSSGSRPSATHTAPMTSSTAPMTA